MFRFILLALVASVSAIVVSKCPDITPVDNFNFASFGQGKWYEVARYANPDVEGAQCGEAEPKLEGNILKVTNRHIVNNKLKIKEGTIELAPDAGKAGKLVIKVPFGPDGATATLNMHILAFNKDYVISYYCKSWDKDAKDFAWIMARSKTLSPETKAHIDNFVKDSKVLKASKFQWLSFSDDNCKTVA